MSKEKEALAAILKEIQHLWFEVEELKTFNFEEDKVKYSMENYGRIKAIEAMLKGEE